MNFWPRFRAKFNDSINLKWLSKTASLLFCVGWDWGNFHQMLHQSELRSGEMWRKGQSTGKSFNASGHHLEWALDKGHYRSMDYEMLGGSDLYAWLATPTPLIRLRTGSCPAFHLSLPLIALVHWQFVHRNDCVLPRHFQINLQYKVSLTNITRLQLWFSFQVIFDIKNNNLSCKFTQFSLQF